MKERPILFSAPMVRALLAGTKTQTRRVLRDQNPIDLGVFTNGSHLSRRPVFDKVANSEIGSRLVPMACPYGQPGDRLWVRETWGYFDPDCSGQDFEEKNNDGARGGPCRTYHAEMMKEGSPLREYWRRRVAYAASWQEPKFGNGPDAPARWRPSIHMPRWASRILLEIVAVRVERLQDISDGDAMREGADQIGDNDGAFRAGYERLWESINGPGSWAANPWVWVIEFKRVTP